MLSDSFQGDRVDKNWNGINDESADAGAESAGPMRLDRRSHAEGSARFHTQLKPACCLLQKLDSTST